MKLFPLFEAHWADFARVFVGPAPTPMVRVQSYTCRRSCRAKSSSPIQCSTPVRSRNISSIEYCSTSGPVPCSSSRAPISRRKVHNYLKTHIFFRVSFFYLKPRSSILIRWLRLGTASTFRRCSGRLSAFLSNPGGKHVHSWHRSVHIGRQTSVHLLGRWMICVTTPKISSSSGSGSATEAFMGCSQSRRVSSRFTVNSPACWRQRYRVPRLSALSTTSRSPLYRLPSAMLFRWHAGSTSRSPMPYAVITEIQIGLDIVSSRAGKTAAGQIGKQWMGLWRSSSRC
ncbi:hypothetical protein BANRA_05639 [Klebsiella pneumoniae]|nr:hypothetical protein BANRA_05639 [Klebsiella pneumoniae]